MPYRGRNYSRHSRQAAWPFPRGSIREANHEGPALSTAVVHIEPVVTVSHVSGLSVNLLEPTINSRRRDNDPIRLAIHACFGSGCDCQPPDGRRTQGTTEWSTGHPNY